MNEQAPRPFPQSDWDPEATAHSLAAPFSERLHAVFGPGYSFRIGDEFDPELVLDIYPDSNTVRLKSKDVFIALGRARTPTLSDGVAIFDYQEGEKAGHLLVTQEGDISFFHTTGGEEIVPMTQPDPWDTPVQSEPTPEPAKPAEKPAAPLQRDEIEDQERVKVEGNVGRGVRVQENRNGGLIVRFEVGEHPNPDDRRETIWHEVYSTKQYAQRIRDESLQKGEEVRVTGIRQSQPYKDDDGQMATKEVIYAFGVKRIKTEGAKRP